MNGERGRILPMASGTTAEPETATPPVFERIAIVGLGLVGGSLSLAARKAWPRALVIGVDRGEVLEKAMVRHAIDVAAEDLMIASEADLVVLAAPVSENEALLARLPEVLSGPAVVTDVGSTKRRIAEAARHLPPHLVFVGGHPLAGSTASGIDNARPDLFTGRPWLFTPEPGLDPTVLERLFAFVAGVGAVPTTLSSPEAHDRLAAFLTHLPQLSASVLMSVIGTAIGEEGLALAGRGLSDTTRLASSGPETWRDVCATNADEIARALDAYIEQLQLVRAGLSSPETITELFTRASEWRERLPRRDP